MIKDDYMALLGLFPYEWPISDVTAATELAEASIGIRGTPSFDRRALHEWISGAEASSPIETTPGISRETRTHLNMLKQARALLGEDEPMRLALGQRAPLAASDRFDAADAASLAALPLRFKPFVADVIAGASIPIALPTRRHAFLEYQPTERRIMPIARMGSITWKLDWEGRILAELPNNTTHTNTTQTVVGARPAAATQRTGTLPVAHRFTVATLTPWLDFAASPDEGNPAPTRAASGNGTTDVSPLFLPLFNGAALGSPISNDHRESADISHAFRHFFCHSPTLRLVFGIAATERPFVRELRFSVERASHPRYDADANIIHTPPAAELRQRRYLSKDGLIPSTPSTVWLHYFLQAATGLSDPPPVLAPNHRGPLIYLTERILYEANRAPLERLAFEAGDADGGPGFTDARVNELLNNMYRENLFLDAGLQRLLPIDGERSVLGKQLKTRVTVLGALAIHTVMAATPALRTDLAVGNNNAGVFDKRVLPRFGLGSPSSAAPDQTIDQLFHLRAFLAEARQIYASTPWNQALIDQWINQDATDRDERQTRWKIIHCAMLPPRLGAHPFHITRNTRTIIVATAPAFHYLSTTGCRPYDYRRRVAGILSHLITPLSALRTPFNARLERGVHVWVENRLTNCSSTHPCRRIAAQIRDEAQAAYAHDTTIARRAADEEDAYVTWAVSSADTTSTSHYRLSPD